MTALNDRYGAENRSAEELLAETLKYQKKAYRRAGITAIAHFLLIITLLALLAAAALFAPRVISLVNHAEESLSAVDALIEEFDGLVSDNTDALTDAIRKLDSIDFDRLNKAIGNLSDAVKPLARFARQFQ